MITPEITPEQVNVIEKEMTRSQERLGEMVEKGDKPKDVLDRLQDKIDTTLALIAFWRANQPTMSAEGYPTSNVPCRHCGAQWVEHCISSNQCPNSVGDGWIETRYTP